MERAGVTLLAAGTHNYIHVTVETHGQHHVNLYQPTSVTHNINSHLITNNINSQSITNNINSQYQHPLNPPY